MDPRGVFISLTWMFGADGNAIHSIAERHPGALIQVATCAIQVLMPTKWEHEVPRLVSPFVTAGACGCDDGLLSWGKVQCGSRSLMGLPA